MAEKVVISKESLAFREGDRVVDPRTNLRGHVLSVTCNPRSKDTTVFYVLAVETEDGGIVRIKHPGHGLRKVESA